MSSRRALNVTFQRMMVVNKITPQPIDVEKVANYHRKLGLNTSQL